MRQWEKDSLRAGIVVHQVHLEELGADAPVDVPVGQLRSRIMRITNKSLTKKLATFCLPRLLIQPVCTSSRMFASINGTPVRPSHQRRAGSSESSRLALCHFDGFGLSDAG